ncbi:ligand-dependent corepressor [Centroberyx gerrardi]
MASLCKRQQCTIERRGFRQELDSWRHKLIHCVGFESILEGLFGPELVEDLKLFHDCEPEAVSDWSFDENCLFCCLRRDKVKEHLVGLSNQGLEDTPKALLVKDQTKINRLEKQAEEFLNAVLCRKDVPSFSDPHIPVVAREIMQRMIRQFAAEYTSKTSSPQDSGSDPQPCSDQSLPRPPSFSGAPPSTSPAATLAASAHNQNPVLSKLLMADQDAPLDLTVKKPPAEPSEQEGVLDLSLKKNRYSSSLPAHSPYLSPTTSTLKGRSLRADGQVGLFMRSLQDGRRRENIGHSTHYKPSQPLAYSLHIKEEVGLAQESDPESPPSHNHSSTPTDLFRNGSASWNTKTHFGALLKLRTNSEASEYLKDLPRLLEAAGLFSKSLSSDKGTIQEARGDQGLSLSPSSSFDLKIPRVRGLSTGTDQSWGSLSSEFSGSLCENGLGKRLRSILPKHGRKGSNGGLDGPGAEKEYWAYDTDRQALGGNYPALDSESDLGNKQPRKKRGRYRQYNTELLEEAIVVVMGGKMSVSKAQSIYGIPHSTLEYKVKERLGTLKHPPKKKLRLLSQVEEQDVSQFPEGHGLQNLQHNESEKRECASTDYGSELFDAGLSPDE